jgi:hypothetical protein
MTPPELIQVLGVATIFLLLGGLGFTGLRWLWKRTDRAAALPSGELEELRSRVAELEGVQDRMGELEERLDFAERLLAQQREPEKLERPK